MRGCSVYREKKKYIKRRPENVGTPPTDPHERAVWDAGGRMIRVALPDREQFETELKLYAPGCGSPMHIVGTQGGTMPCGGMFNWSGEQPKQVFCQHCDSKSEGVLRSY